MTKIGCASIFGLILLFFVLCFATGFFLVTGRGVTAEEANRRIHQKLDVPPQGGDVNYYSSVAYSVASFAISESDFEAWCRSRGWKTHLITRDSMRFPDTRSDPGPFRLIDDGLWFDARNGDFGFGGFFHRKAGRAWVSFSTR